MEAVCTGRQLADGESGGGLPIGIDRLGGAQASGERSGVFKGADSFGDVEIVFEWNRRVSAGERANEAGCFGAVEEGNFIAGQGSIHIHETVYLEGVIVLAGRFGEEE